VRNWKAQAWSIEMTAGVAVANMLEHAVFCRRSVQRCACRNGGVGLGSIVRMTFFSATWSREGHRLICSVMRSTTSCSTPALVDSMRHQFVEQEHTLLRRGVLERRLHRHAVARLLALLPRFVSSCHGSLPLTWLGIVTRMLLARQWAKLWCRNVPCCALLLFRCAI